MAWFNRNKDNAKEEPTNKKGILNRLKHELTRERHLFSTENTATDNYNTSLRDSQEYKIPTLDESLRQLESQQRTFDASHLHPSVQARLFYGSANGTFSEEDMLYPHRKDEYRTAQVQEVMETEQANSFLEKLYDSVAGLDLNSLKSLGKVRDFIDSKKESFAKLQLSDKVKDMMKGYDKPLFREGKNGYDFAHAAEVVLESAFKNAINKARETKGDITSVWTSIGEGIKRTFGSDYKGDVKEKAFLAAAESYLQSEQGDSRAFFGKLARSLGIDSEYVKAHRDSLRVGINSIIDKVKNKVQSYENSNGISGFVAGKVKKMYHAITDAISLDGIRITDEDRRDFGGMHPAYCKK